MYNSVDAKRSGGEIAHVIDGWWFALQVVHLYSLGGSTVRVRLRIAAVCWLTAVNHSDSEIERAHWSVQRRDISNYWCVTTRRECQIKPKHFFVIDRSDSETAELLVLLIARGPPAVRVVCLLLQCYIRVSSSCSLKTLNICDLFDTLLNLPLGY